jgi:hypothetical protein
MNSLAREMKNGVKISNEEVNDKQQYFLMIKDSLKTLNIKSFIFKRNKPL